MFNICSEVPSVGETTTEEINLKDFSRRGSATNNNLMCWFGFHEKVSKECNAGRCHIFSCNKVQSVAILQTVVIEMIVN